MRKSRILFIKPLKQCRAKSNLQKRSNLPDRRYVIVIKFESTASVTKTRTCASNAD
jgi:hypothetical protein